jgi:hypothetical protein
VHVVGKHNPGIDVEGPSGAFLANGLAQDIDMRDEQCAVTIVQIDGEKVGPARDAIAAVVWHRAIVPNELMWRKALRFSALPHRPAALWRLPDRLQMAGCTHWVFRAERI